jgi:hypothetical protein
MWTLRNLPAQIYPNPIFIVGNQKTGSTAIAALLAKAAGMPARLDIFYQIPYPAEKQLLEKTLSFPRFVHANKGLFSKPLIKEPGLIFHLDDLVSFFPDSKLVFLMRDPRDNIRSILNRLQLPGNQTDLTPQQFQNLPTAFWKMVMEGYLYQSRGATYIETLALRWLRIVELYERHAGRMVRIQYEEFLKEKTACIHKLAKKLNLSVISDISSQVDIQYQSKGDSSISAEQFFGEYNLAKIEQICRLKMQQYGYSLRCSNT